MPRPTAFRIPPPRRSGRPALRAELLVASLLLLLAPTDSLALLRLDFEQTYYVHPGRQVWDFCLIRPDSVYHIFYHGILETTPHATRADTIWHATSPDLRHWNAPTVALTVAGTTWEASAIWAPDVVRDEANQRWAMAYTACDAQVNQRVALAVSDDLENWTRVPENPVVQPDSTVYKWLPTQWWSNFRDPFLYRQDDQWHMLVTALQWLGTDTGVLWHGVSDDLIDWTDAGILFANDGTDPWRVPESPQYVVRGSTHHLLFGEYDTVGISLVSGPSPAEWTMAQRVFIDYGYAPEIKQFDPDIDLFARLAPYLHPQTQLLSYAVRIDTLQVTDGGATLTVAKPHPLGAQWASWTGTSTLANPTFGDNPAFRGQTPAGTIGNSYFGSSEYYQGPLSGRGSPGTQLGDAATGSLTSHPFVITGDVMQLRVGGGDYPETCYVALVRSSDEAILYRETGGDEETMTLREWDLRPYRGDVATVRIVDAATGSFGHINVDEIVEVMDENSASPVPIGRTVLGRHSAYPNPFNPRTAVRFELLRDATVTVRVLDVRGREVWSSGARSFGAGEHRLAWNGTDRRGAALPAGTYLYALHVDGAVAGGGKLVLLK